MDLLVNLVREEVEAMEERVKEEVIKQMEKRELLLMAEMERLEKRLSPRREKRQHSEKQSQKKTPQSDNSFSRVLQKTSKESLQYEQQANQSVQNGDTNPQS